MNKMKKPALLLMALLLALLPLVSGLSEYLYGWEESPDPCLEIDGVKMRPVFFSDAYWEISQILGEDNVPYEKNVWYARLEVQDGPLPREAVEKAAGQIMLYLYCSDNTGYEIRDLTVLTEGDPVSEFALMYSDRDMGNVEGAALKYGEYLWGLINLRDFTDPASLSHTPLPEVREEELKALLQQEYGNYVSMGYFHNPGLKMLIVLFDANGSIVKTSLDAGGSDFGGIPAGLLAPSYEEAEEIILIYRYPVKYGTYSDGSTAYETCTRAIIKRGSSITGFPVTSNYAPMTKMFSGDAYGPYSPYDAFDFIPGWVAMSESHAGED